MERTVKKNATKEKTTLDVAVKTLRDKIANWALIVSQIIIVAQTVLLPIIFVPFTVLSLTAVKLSFFYSATLLALIAYLLYFIISQKKKLIIPFGILSCGLTAVFITYSLAAVFSTNSFISVWGRDFTVDSLLSIAVFFIYGLLVSIHVVQDKNIILKIVFGSVATSFLVIVLELVIIFFGNVASAIFSDMGISSVGNWSSFGFFAMFMIVVLLFCVTQLKLIKKIQWFIWITILLYLAFLCISGNTLAWILIGIACLTLFLFQFFTKRTFLVSAMVLCVVSILFVVFAPRVNDILLNRFGFPIMQNGLSSSSSIYVLQTTLQTNPVWGVGPARYESHLPIFFSDVMVSEQFWQVDFRYATSYLLTLPVTVGIVGAVPWLAIPVGLLFLLIAFYSKKKYLQSYEHRVFFLAIVLSFLLLVVCSLQLPSVVIITCLTLCIGICFGVAFSLGLVPHKEIIFARKTTHLLANIIIVLLIVIVIGLLVEVAQKTRAELLFTQSQQKLVSGATLEDVVIDLTNAQNLYANDTYALSQNKVLLLQLETILTEQSAGVRDGATVEIIKKINDNFVSAIVFDQNNYRTYIDFGNFYRLLLVLAEPEIANEAYEESKNRYKKSLDLKPDNPEVFLEIARLEEVYGSIAQARSAFEKALEIRPDYYEAMLYAVNFEQVYGTKNSTLTLLRSFVESNPDDVLLRLMFAEAQVQVKNFNGAINSIRRLVSLGVDRDQALLQIVNSLIVQDLRSEAYQFLEQVQSVFGPNQTTKDLLEILTV